MSWLPRKPGYAVSISPQASPWALLLERRDLRFGEHHALLGDLLLERDQTLLHRLEAVPLPHASDPRRGDVHVLLAKLVADPHLAQGRFVRGQREDGLFDLGRRPVAQIRAAFAAPLHQRLDSAFVGRLLVPIERVAAVAHHLACPGHVPELFREP